MINRYVQVGLTLDLVMEESSMKSEEPLDFELFNVVAVTAVELFALLVLILCNVIGIRWLFLFYAIFLLLLF